jgi:hypothetical protein
MRIGLAIRKQDIRPPRRPNPAPLMGARGFLRQPPVAGSASTNSTIGRELTRLAGDLPGNQRGG